MDIEQLADDQKAKVRACQTPEELLTVAQEEGYELSDEELEAVAGGWGEDPCPSYEGCWDLG